MIFAVITLFGCSDRAAEKSNSDEEPVVIDKQLDDYDAYVGHLVILKGTVTNSKHPYLLGIGCWELDRHRNKKVTVLGRISKTIITEKDAEKMLREWIANEGTSVFYELDDVKLISQP